MQRASTFLCRSMEDNLLLLSSIFLSIFFLLKAKIATKQQIMHKYDFQFFPSIPIFLEYKKNQMNGI